MSSATTTTRRITPLPFAGAEKRQLRDVWGETLLELAREFPDLVVLDGDLANSTRADIIQGEMPERFFEMGIAEQNMVGVAAGMATLGFVPWLSTFAAFMANRATDQVRIVVAQPGLNVKMCGAYSGILTGKTGKTHQSVEDFAIFRAMPGVVTIAPADAVEMRAAMRVMQQTPGPMYLRVTRDPSPTIFPADYEFRIGEGILLREGADIALISTGVQTIRVLEAAELLAADGVEASVLHLPTLKPIDEDAIVEVAARCGRVLTSEDHSIIGGLGSAVAEVLSQRQPTRLRINGLRDVYGESAPNDYLLEKYGISATHIAREARELIAAG
ncbi:MAG: transketolase C-terminal domain-containing protein [Thermomicrobiales bacterium]